jgi:hypothetical protein
VGQLDARAQHSLPDSLMGRLVQFGFAHEVGHTSRLRHNMKGARLPASNSIRSRSWVGAMGHARPQGLRAHSTVARPRPDADRLDHPQVAPTDTQSVRATTPIDGARTPDDESPRLDRWERMKDTIPCTIRRRRGDPGPTGRGQRGGWSAERRARHALGLRNMRRVAKHRQATTDVTGETTTKPRGDDAARRQVATELDTWRDPGRREQKEKVSDSAARFTCRTVATQARRVSFLNRTPPLTTPTFLLDRGALAHRGTRGSGTHRARNAACSPAARQRRMQP